MSKQSSSSSSLLSNNALITLSIIWALLAIFIFLFFSVLPEGADTRPNWYLNTITIIETGAFLFASFLCFRNWQSSQIVSGRGVWLSIGIGLLLYAGGNIFFYLWNNVFGLDPSVSFGDFFYLSSYVFLAVGMFKAVLPRRLNLDPKQWAIVVIVAVLGAALAIFPQFGGDEAAIAPPMPPSVSARVTLASPAWAQDPPPAEPAPAEPVPAESAPAEPTPTEPVPVEVDEAPPSTAPGWAVSIDNLLDPFVDIVGYLYIFGDWLLLVVATTLLVAFWGGRFSQSWKLIAIAAFCLYIADMFFAYQDNYIEGAVWEVFWTFSALFFGLGAVVENAISSRSRRGARRRRVQS
ncbi:hypothetical protein [Leptolyngbya iicbica]|uniref:Uncharacterized protein n=2 Tax=Cyanophyceae TaxID=3028117 RepID=A0A4Q7E046_9CYAN|nr:hypothetical protein [Leptolyngbya sp. LK]RZM74703.1 hypothetical protein DYY88_23185 [Leptolyngbya sp. LK]